MVTLVREQASIRSASRERGRGHEMNEKEKS
jgi:hypothetical protein